MTATGWLIERDGKWLGPRCTRFELEHWDSENYDGPELFTVDANLAWRFARREDAEAWAKFEGMSAITITEHIWLGTATVVVSAPHKRSPPMTTGRHGTGAHTEGENQ